MKYAIRVCGVGDPVADCSDCPNNAEHTPSPRGYLPWHEWAEAMSKTHRQVRCPGCGLWKVWVARGNTPEAKDGER